jgi:hypothetical protein
MSAFNASSFPVNFSAFFSDLLSSLLSSHDTIPSMFTVTTTGDEGSSVDDAAGSGSTKPHFSRHKTIDLVQADIITEQHKSFIHS